MSDDTQRGAGQEQVIRVAVDRIAPNPAQPRRHIRPEQLRTLAQSIRSRGMIQPVILRPHRALADHYELVAGERRWRAIRLLGWSTAPAIVRDVPDEELLETALVENLQREQLSPIEEALAYRQLIEQHGFTQESLSQRIGKERSTIANMIRLLGLPFPIQRDLEEDRLTVGHARALLALSDPVRQTELRNLVLARGLSVRETERLVGQERSRASRAGASALDAEAGRELETKFQAVRDDLERRLATGVTIRQSRGQGRIEIEFFSIEDFNRIHALLLAR